MKRQPAKPKPREPGLGPVVRVFASFLLVGVVAVGFVWQNHEITVLDGRIRRTADQNRDYTLAIGAMSARLNILESSSNVISMVTQYGLDLQRVRPGQVIRLQMSGERPVLRGVPEGREPWVVQALPFGQGSPN